MLFDDLPIESQLNTMCWKAYILMLLGQQLDDSLIAIAIIISLPSFYAVLYTILVSSKSKHALNEVTNAILTEEKT